VRRCIIAAVAVLALLGAGCGQGEEAANLPLGRAVTAKASLTPNVHLFAEPVLARLDVVVDRERYDPGRVHVSMPLLPYKATGRVERSRKDHGRFTRLRYEVELRCLSVDCIPKIVPSAAGEQESGRGDRREFTFEAARVLYSGEDDEAKPTLLRSTRWPVLESVSRINASSIPRYGFVFRTSVTPLPEPTERAPPRLLGAGLIAGAMVLLALPMGLVGRWYRRRQPPPPEPEPELPPLERALLLVEWARGRVDGADRREALEVLAVELDASGRAGLAGTARELAWSSESPSSDAAADLVESVKESVDAPS
jgi:hypothetical protein